MLLEAAEAGDRAKLRQALMGAQNEKEGSGLDPNSVRNEGGATALMLAAQQGSTSCVRLLLGRGADADIQEHDGWNALMFAVKVKSVTPCAIDTHAPAAPHALTLLSALRCVACSASSPSYSRSSTACGVLATSRSSHDDRPVTFFFFAWRALPS